MKLTEQEAKVLAELRAKEAAEQSKAMAQDMAARAADQIQRILTRIETHSHVKVNAVTVDCTNGYAVRVQIEE